MTKVVPGGRLSRALGSLPSRYCDWEAQIDKPSLQKGQGKMVAGIDPSAVVTRKRALMENHVGLCTCLREGRTKVECLQKFVCPRSRTIGCVEIVLPELPIDLVVVVRWFDAVRLPYKSQICWIVVANVLTDEEFSPCGWLGRGQLIWSQGQKQL